jgi:hypothetical protein
MAMTLTRASDCARPWLARPEFAPAARDALPGLQWFGDALHLPFDVMRTQHAEAVHAGLLANSMLGSRDFEQAVDALEHVTLGPFARHV